MDGEIERYFTSYKFNLSPQRWIDMSGQKWIFRARVVFFSDVALRFHIISWQKLPSFWYMASGFSNLNLFCNAAKLIHFYLVSDNCILSHVVLTRIAGRVVEVNVLDLNKTLESIRVRRIHCIFIRTQRNLISNKASFDRSILEWLLFISRRVLWAKISHITESIQVIPRWGNMSNFALS